MNKTRTFSPKKQNTFLLLSICFGGLIFSYIMLVGLTVFNTLARQQAEKTIAHLHTTVSELEFSYVNVTSDMTLEKAKTLGFVEVGEFLVARNDNVALSR